MKNNFEINQKQLSLEFSSLQISFPFIKKTVWDYG